MEQMELEGPLVVQEARELQQVVEEVDLPEQEEVGAFQPQVELEDHQMVPILERWLPVVMAVVPKHQVGEVVVEAH
jgi:hypothetical protein